MQNRHSALLLAGLTVLLVPGSLAQAEAANSKTKAKEVPKKLEVNPLHFEIDLANPEANLPSGDEAAAAPLLFANLLNEFGSRLDDAQKVGDWEQAAKLNRAYLRIAPQVATGHSGLCQAYEMLGKRDDALQACANAIQKPGVKVDDFVRFVRLVNARPGALDPTELEDARNAIAHLQSEAASRVAGYQLACELELKLKNDAAFESCTTEFAKLAPNDPKSIAFSWSVAMKKHDLQRAQELLERAKANGQMQDAVAKMEKGMHAPSTDSGAAASSLASSPMVRWLAGLVVALLAALFVARKLVRSRSASL